jgi:superfamily II DNA or RNA helicase
VKLLLLKEFAVVQGPPGTGKTFIGLKVVEAMLINQQRAGWKGPLVVMCYTNHALDQFLEGVLKFEPNIVRIGSRSKSKAVNVSSRRSTQIDPNPYEY